MPYICSPDMIAFTIGRLIIDRLKKGEDVSIKAIETDLSLIAAGQHAGRISPAMAGGALQLLRSCVAQIS